ncbi:MAG: S8 family serine peptidase, partial [Chloroflexia bacterium]
MQKQLTRYHPGHRSYWIRVRALFALVLILPAITVFSAPKEGAAQARIQTALLAMAAQQPDAMVSVIVQKSVTDRSPEYAVKALGGKLTKDLSIINAFAVEIPARSIESMAKIGGIKWVSLDAPVDKSGGVAEGASKGGATPTPTSEPLFESLPGEFTTWGSELVAGGTSSISSGFTSTTIRANSTIWFNSVLRVNGLGSGPTTITFDNGNVQVSIMGQQYSLNVPKAEITFSPSVSIATTSYDAVNGQWVTMLPMGQANKDVFLTGSAIKTPYDIPGVATAVTFSGRFTTNRPNVTVSSWEWAASTYSTFNENNAIGVKPTDDGSASQWHNSDNAGTPENYKAYLVPGARGNGGTNYTGDYSPAASVTPPRLFNSADLIVDGGTGPNNTYGWGSNGTQTIGGFLAERGNNQRISQVEVALDAYVPTMLSSTEDPRISVLVNGQTVSNVTVQNTNFDPLIGQAHAGLIYVNVTGTRNWTWGDFDNGLQVKLDQSMFSSSHSVYYDAVGLRVTAVAGTDNSGGVAPPSQTSTMPDANALINSFNKTVRASDVWGTRQGQGQTIAVIDSGVVKTDDLKGRIVAAANFDDNEHDSNDSFGHGTFVAGIIAGDGKASDGQYMGIAPKASILNVRVSGDQGIASESDTIEALQWVLTNKDRYNVQVVNMSLNSSLMQSYNTSPLCAAVEVMWFNKMVMVVSAGNNGTANLYPPANDPFVITVGATDDKGTPSLSDDTLATFSAWGTTGAGTVKPEIVAP